MAIPNTTQIPNNLFDEEMPKMKDTELRIVLLVARKTLGWILDEKTGMRKKEDWISRSQLERLTGRSGRALSSAIDVCVKMGWLEARDKDGNVLDTKKKRFGKKIFYRLGRIFLDKKGTCEKNSQVEKTCELFSPEKSSHYKRKTNNKNINNNLEEFIKQKEKIVKELSMFKPQERTKCQEEAALKERLYKRGILETL